MESNNHRSCAFLNNMINKNIGSRSILLRGKKFCLIIAGLLSLLGRPGLLSADALSAQDQASFTAAMQKQLEFFQTAAAETGNPLETRQLTEAAMLSMLLGGDPGLAQEYVNRAFETQEMSPQSGTYGQVCWQTNQTAVTDRNAIEFAAEPLGPLLINYGKQFSPQFLQGLYPHIKAAIAGIENHHVEVSYTNIYLMKATNLLLLGQYLNDTAAINEGETQLDGWIAYTRQNGIHEFDSPTYYEVDLASLEEGHRYAANPEDRKKYAAILNYFWTDLAANYFAAAQKISGPYSRDYDFLRGQGRLANQIIAAGIAPFDPKNPLIFGSGPNIECVFLLDNLRPGGYWPGPAIVNLAHGGTREVTSRWLAGPEGQRWAWLGEHIALGVTSGWYDPQDKLFAITFAGKELPQASVVVDAYDFPYGLTRVKYAAGYSKPVHMPGNFASVQSGGAALITLDVDTAQLPAGAKSLTTNILLPSASQIAINGNTVDLSEPGTIPINPDSVVTVNIGGAAAAFRVFYVHTYTDPGADPGATPPIELAADKEGLANGVVRIRLLQMADIPPGTNRKDAHFRVGLAVVVADGDRVADLTEELRQAGIKNEFDADHWTVQEQLPGLTLQVDRSVSNRRKIYDQQINGASAATDVLGVNGRDLAGPIWAELQE